MLVKTTLSALAALAIWSAPAAANEAFVNGVMDLTESDEHALGAEEQASEFEQLFANWQTLEEGGRVTKMGDVVAAPQAGVSIPEGMPVEGVTLTSAFGMRDHPVLRRRAAHKGVDLAAPSGTPVYATADGIVGMAQYYSSYGNYVQIEHGGEMQTRFAHLSSYTVSEGDTVKKGELIGYIGSTGRSTGPHLHYEIRIEGEAVNPVPYMVTQLAVDNDRRAARGGPE